MYRVLHVVDSLLPGGTELQMLLNIEGIQGGEFESHVCYIHAPNSLQPELDKLGVPVYSLGFDRKKYQWFRGVSRLTKLVKDLDIDLIHTNLFVADIMGGVAGRITKRPVISTIANVVFEPQFLVDNPRLSRVKLLAPKYVRSVVANTCNTHLIAVSETVAMSTIKHLRVPPQKTSVIYRALAPHWLEPVDSGRIEVLRGELGLAGSWPVLLSVGRLAPQKGQRYAIDAMAEVVKEFPKAKLLIAGDGILKPKLIEQRDSLGLTDQVVFLGRRNDVKDLHAVSDMFVFPSLFEGCPNALIEATAMGSPCVASKIDSIEEVVKHDHTGILVPLQDSQALAGAIIRLCRNQGEAATLGQRARVNALKRFTASSSTKKLKELYLSVLENRNGLEHQSSLKGATEQ